MSVLLSVALLIAGVYGVAVLEGWADSGRWRWRAPVSDSVSILLRESLVPRQADRLLFETAPVLLLLAAVLAACVLPLYPTSAHVNLATGALFVNAAFAYVLVALIMAGWGPNGAYAMVGGWRFLAQLIAYSMLIVMPITAVAMRAESMLASDIIASQAGVWNVFYQPLGFVLFWIAAMALAYMRPFDLPNADTELAGGVEAEYTGVRYAVWRLGRLTLILTLALATTVFYLGGWHGPWIPPVIWSVLKTIAVAAAMMGLGRYLPRVSEADLMAWCWKLGIPLALLNIFVVGVMLLVL